MHVLILPSWYPTCHARLSGIFFREQAQALRKAGVKVGVIYPELRSLRTVAQGGLLQNRFQVSEQDEDSIPTLRVHGWNIPKFPRINGRMWLIQARRVLGRYMEAFGRPDLIHAHSALWGGVAAAQAFAAYGILYVVTEHSSAYAHGLIRPWQVPHIKAAFHNAAQVWAVSRALGERLAPYAGDREIGVVPNMVDTGFFRLPPEPPSPRTFRFLTVGFLTPNKGIDVLIRAFARAFCDSDRVVLEIGGDGIQRRELEALAAEMGVTDGVRFLGMLCREQVREAMWRANAFVLPSYVETFGLVLIEAMATGLPVIATRCGGPEEFVTPEIGYLIPSGDAKALAAALSAVCEQHAGWQRRGRAIRAYAEARFGARAVAEGLTRCYQKVAGVS